MSAKVSVLQKPVLLDIELDDIRPMDGQPRIVFDEGELDQLGDTLTISQEQRITVIRNPEATSKPHYELNDGERRWRAAKKKGLKTIEAIVVPYEDWIDRFEKGFRANLGVPLSPYEKMLSVAKMVERRGYSSAEIARRTSIKQVTVDLYLLLVKKLHPEILKLLTPELPPEKRLRLMVAYQLTRHSHAEQLRLAPQMLGMGEQQAKALIRVRTHGNVRNTDGSGRKPSEEYFAFIGMLERVRRNATVYSGMGRDVFQKMFSSRSSEDARLSIRDIDEAISSLRKMRGHIAKIKTT